MSDEIEQANREKAQRLAEEGKSQREIAERMGISEYRVRKYLSEED